MLRHKAVTAEQVDRQTLLTLLAVAAAEPLRSEGMEIKRQVAALLPEMAALVRHRLFLDRQQPMQAAVVVAHKQQTARQELLEPEVLVAVATEPTTIQLLHLEQLILAEAAVAVVIRLRLVAQAAQAGPASSSSNTLSPSNLS